MNRCACWMMSVAMGLALAACAGPARQADPAVLTELAATGKLRVGVATAPARTPLFVVADATGHPDGVTVELGNELARRLGVPVEFFVAPNTGELVKASSAGNVDVAFMPVDEERKKTLDFGPAYFVIESTGLVAPGVDIRTLADVDRAGVRVVGVANTATIRAAGRWLKNTSIAPVGSIDEAIELLRTGRADVFTLTHDALPPLAAKLPGSRILDGAFLRADVAVAVPKSRPHALAYVTQFMQDAKSSGTVQRAFEHAGLKDLAVAP